MGQADLLAQVKTATRAQHERLEGILPFQEMMSSKHSYRHVLEAFVGLFDPIENALAAAELPDGVEFEKRRRSPLLVRDLETLGLSPKQIEKLPRCGDIPHLHGSDSALGAMYVLEGSTLGGQYISRVLEERLGITDKTGSAFFSSYGAEIGPMWRKFCDVARQIVITPDGQRRFVSSAQATFSTFEEWLKR